MPYIPIYQIKVLWWIVDKFHFDRSQGIVVYTIKFSLEKNKSEANPMELNEVILHITLKTKLQVKNTNMPQETFMKENVRITEIN